MDFLFSPSGFLAVVSFENPTCFVSIHFSTDFFISNKCIEDLLDVQAIIFMLGWKFKLVIKALLEPLLNSYNRPPSSALNILIIVPLTDAVAIRVPSALTAKAPTSDSCA